jgi:hypothetical protein
VSDQSQGPGWWLASDGKWYPADGGSETVHGVQCFVITEDGAYVITFGGPRAERASAEAINTFRVG